MQAIHIHIVVKREEGSELVSNSVMRTSRNRSAKPISSFLLPLAITFFTFKLSFSFLTIGMAPPLMQALYESMPLSTGRKVTVSLP